MRSWRRATASDPQLAGRPVFELDRCEVCGSAVTVDAGDDPGDLYEAGTYSAERRAFAPLLEPLRRLAERDRLRFFDCGAGRRPGPRARRRRRPLRRPARQGRLRRARDRALAERLRGGGEDRRQRSSTRAPRTRRSSPRGEDAVVVWHALEHLADPEATVSRIRDWLAPGGPADRRRPRPRQPPGADRRRSLVSSGRAPPPHPLHPPRPRQPARARRPARGPGPPPAGRAESARHVADPAQPPHRRARLRLPADQARPRRRRRRRRSRATCRSPRSPGRCWCRSRSALELGAGLAGRGGHDGGRGDAVSEPSVSVVVPTLGAARLERLLDSLAAQTAAHQTIVVDNGSGDGARRRRSASPTRGSRCCASRPTPATRAPATSAPATATARSSCCSTTTASAIPASSRRSRPRSIAAPGWRWRPA